MRQMAKGSSLGSKRQCWILPCQMKRWPRIRSSTCRAALVGQAAFPQRHFEVALLRLVRIEADRDQNEVRRGPASALP